ncbi:unnamed protein product [Arctogadus glacialis]
MPKRTDPSAGRRSQAGMRGGRVSVTPEPTRVDTRSSSAQEEHILSWFYRLDDSNLSPVPLSDCNQRQTRRQSEACEERKCCNKKAPISVCGKSAIRLLDANS